MEAKTAFETETCTRCGGCGNYSFNLMYGTVCFGCGGKGWRFTKRGAAAKGLYVSLISRPARLLQPGDLFRSTSSEKWVRVLAVGESEHIQNGQRLVCIETKGCRSYVYPDGYVQVAPTEAERDTFIAFALAYQERLGKSGKPLGSRSKKEGAK